MLDQALDPIATPAHNMLQRLTSQFAHLSDAALARISQGGAAGYVTPDLARALIDARDHLVQVRT